MRAILMGSGGRLGVTARAIRLGAVMIAVAGVTGAVNLQRHRRCVAVATGKHPGGRLPQMNLVTEVERSLANAGAGSERQRHGEHARSDALYGVATSAICRLLCIVVAAGAVARGSHQIEAMIGACAVTREAGDALVAAVVECARRARRLCGERRRRGRSDQERAGARERDSGQFGAALTSIHAISRAPSLPGRELRSQIQHHGRLNTVVRLDLVDTGDEECLDEEGVVRR